MTPITPTPPTKAQLRKRYADARRAIPPAERERRSLLIVERVLALPEAERAENWFIYLAAGAEVQTRPLIAALLARGRCVAVPRVLDGPGRMEAVLITELEDLVPGKFGIETPGPNATDLLTTTPDLTIVPGLAFTASASTAVSGDLTSVSDTPTSGVGERLGQGGGYYDRYLAQHPTTHKLGLCYTEQLVDTLPIDPHDIPMNRVIFA